MCRLVLLLTAVIAAAGCCGCAGDRTLTAEWIALPPEALERLECHHVISNRQAGSAVHIGGNRLWLSAHVIEGEIPVMEVDGEPTGYTVVERGPDDGTFVGDWVVIQLHDVTLASRSVLDDWDPERPAPEGSRLIVKGFHTLVPLTRKALRELSPTVIEPVVRNPPWGRSRELIYLQPPTADGYPGGGSSGGCVYEWDPDAGRFYFHGILQGRGWYKFLGLTTAMRLVVRRPPWNSPP